MNVTGRRVAAGAALAAAALGLGVLQQAHHGQAASVDLGQTPAAGVLPAGPRGTLWVVAVGVSRYRKAELDLQFADQDARAIAASLAQQRGGPLYRQVDSSVLTNEQATRASILDALQRILRRAGPEDVVTLFIAGHGVRDLVGGSYYFLPFDATPQNLITDGLRMSDLDEMVQLLRRTVRGVVLMLDTCHAGALRLPASQWVAANAAADAALGDGVFLLAATTPGEDSTEAAKLGHGAFTFALLDGLRGAADADGDGWLTVSELFSYVARRVPEISGGQQHPYQKTEGTNLFFEAVRPNATLPAGALESGAPQVPAPTPALNTIGVMEFRDLRAETRNEWIGKALRVAFNTELSKVRELRVYSPDLIDREAAGRRADDLSIAQRLGIRKLVTGSFHVVGDTLRIDAEIVDTVSGLQQGSDSIEGRLDQFFLLEKQLVLSILRRLPVTVSAAEGQSIRKQTNTDVDAYRLLLESEGLVSGAPTPTRVPPPPGPQSTGGVHSWDGWVPWARAAMAAEVADAEPAIRRLLEAYRAALERKDLDRLAALYVSFPARQRAALRAYLDSATRLRVEISDIRIERQRDDVAVTYTRRDRFVDAASGKPQQLEVRLTRIVVRENGQWKIAGGR